MGGFIEGMWYRANHFEFTGSVLRRGFNNHVQCGGWLPHHAIPRPATSPRRVEHSYTTASNHQATLTAIAALHVDGEIALTPQHPSQWILDCGTVKIAFPVATKASLV